jgi:hypothetical protein
MEHEQDTIKLPEWKHALDKMQEIGTDYGAVFEAKWLSIVMKMEPDTLQFGIAISSIRKALRREGKHLTGQGQNGERYIIAPPQDNYRELHRLNKIAVRSLKEGVILGTSTPTDMLDANDRRRHEALTERLAIRSALLRRTDGKLKEANRFLEAKTA